VSWKKRLQILDMDADDKIEARCKACGFTWYEWPCVYYHKSHMRYLYLDEFEKKLRCQQWNCKGDICIALSSEAETEGFQGGLA